MLSQVAHCYRSARLAWRFLLREERKCRSGAPVHKRIDMLRRGFLSQAASLYNLADYALDDYFSDWAKARMSMMYDRRNVRAGYHYGLNNKLFSTAILGRHVGVPEIYAIVEHGRVVPLDEREGCMSSDSWFEATQRAGGRLVLKPSAGSCGRGVFFLDANEGGLLLNGARVTSEDVNALVKSLNEYIVVEFIQQGRYAAGLYPEATNTMRLVTIIDPETNCPYMPFAVQRIGRAASKPVDNWFQSGLSAEIDLQSGTLSRAAARETENRRLVWHESHPDTAAKICGAAVPRWDSIKREVLQTARRLAYFKFMSWDVVARDDDIVVIEADTVSAIDLLQVHRPMLKDERLRRFFEYHGYVKPKHGRRSVGSGSAGATKPA